MQTSANALQSQGQSPTCAQIEDIRRTLTFFHPDASTFELCGIGTDRFQKAVDGGFFNDHERAVKAAEDLTREHHAVYVTINPVKDALLGRACNRIFPNLARTQDKDVTRIRRLLIDADPLRPSKISSSDAEKTAALGLCENIKAELAGAGWPEPLVGDSGNGGHLVYPIDLENTPANVQLIKSCLEALAQKYSNDIVEIDQSVFNPARISKVYGTWARKGDNTPDRPHRVARIISVPENPQPVSLELLEALAKTATTNVPSKAGSGTPGTTFDLAGYLEHYGLQAKQVKAHGESTLYVLEKCLFDDTHTGGEAAIGQAPDGTLFYQCYHNSCKSSEDRKWEGARRKISGSDRLGQFIQGRECAAHSSGNGQEVPEDKSWNFAAELFPRVQFPWHVLPEDLALSLKQLARSCACGPDHLPGVVFAILGGLLGRALSISSKVGWEEPLIIWFSDIRRSGAGKTPPAQLLMGPLKESQEAEYVRFEAEQTARQEWKELSKAEQEGSAKPKQPVKPRGYFVTDLTLEGIQADLEKHPTGGIIVVQDEISAFIGGQNQYKSGKGTDRESWLKLHDGNPARVVRANRTAYIRGARVSIFGGVQPRVFGRTFSSENGLYLEDGTLFRFLLTHEPSRHYDLDAAAWGNKHRTTWEEIVKKTKEWVEKKVLEAGEKPLEPHTLLLSTDAQTRFFCWRNGLNTQLGKLPYHLQGFLPKAYGYALRLTGIIYALRCFSSKVAPCRVIGVQDLDRGIAAVEFYLGQTVDAMRLLKDAGHAPPDTPERLKLLAETLESLRGQIDSGRLAVGFIFERFNAGASEQMQLKSAKAMGALLRSIPLTMADALHDVNGLKRVHCLEWDTKTDSFIQQSLESLVSLGPQSEQGSMDRDIENITSPTSRHADLDDSGTETSETSEEQGQTSRNGSGQHAGDLRDVRDLGAREEEQAALDEFF